MRLNSKGIIHLIPLILIAVGVVVVIVLVLVSKGVIKKPFVSKKEPTVQLKTEYKNPFDKKTQYVNPFDPFKNPIVTAK